MFRKPPKGYAASHGGGWWKWLAKTVQVNMELIWVVFFVEVYLAFSSGFSRSTLWLLIVTVLPAAIAVAGVHRWESKPRQTPPDPGR